MIKFDSIRDFVAYDANDNNLQKAKNKYIQNIIDSDKVSADVKADVSANVSADKVEC